MSFLGIYVINDRGYSAKWYGALGAQILLDAPIAGIAVTFIVSSSLRGCFEPVAYAMCTDLARLDQRTAAFGLQRMGTNLGWALGPALGGLLATVVPYGAVFFLASAGLLGAAALCFRIEHAGGSAVLERVPLRGALREAVGHPPMLALLGATVLFALAHTQMFTLLTVYLSDELALSKFSIGIIYAVNGSLVLLLQWPALGAIKRFGIVRVLPIAALVFALGFLLVGVAAGLVGGMCAIAVITAGEVLFAPAHQTAAAQSGDAARLGKSFGLVSWAQTVGIAFAPLLGGTLFDAIRDRHLLLWSVIAGLCVTLAGVLVGYGRLTRRHVTAGT
jgi:predicted MFS family arabinose efflux permease